MTPEISIIVPVYGVEAYLDRCICSVLAQSFRDFELLLVVDGSPDRCPEICRSYEKKDSRIRVFEKENGGLSSARNYGLDRARGAYIMFVDADDFIAPDACEYLLLLLERFPQCSVSACGHYVMRKGKLRPAGRPAAGVRCFSRPEAFEELLYHGAVDAAAWGKLYRASVFRSLRFPEGRLYEDTWIIGDVLRRTGGVAAGDRVCYYYRVRGTSIVNSAFGPEKLQFIDSAEKLGRDALRCVSEEEHVPPELEERIRTGCIRRVNHARLSVLRYMERCGRNYKALRRELRRKVLREAPAYLFAPGIPGRDRIAVVLLRLGYIPFYVGWRLYACR